MKQPADPPKAWTKSPISCELGTIWLSGSLRDKSTISRERMRILGNYAIVLVLDGEAYYADTRGRQTTLRPGDAIWVDPDLPHAYGGLNGGRWKQAYAIFSGPQFDLMRRDRGFGEHLPVWHLEPVDLWRQRLQEILEPARPGPPQESLRSVGRFAQLLIEMAAADSSRRQTTAETWLEQSLFLLGEPHKDGWMTPQDVARQVGFSYESFRKRFSEATGHPPGQFQQRRRIDLACAAIYQGRDNFKELSEELGFCDVYHFSKVFRRLTGRPPAVYRRSVRGG